ncbi:response regulator [Microvirga sp. 0TCS3.31]
MHTVLVVDDDDDIRDLIVMTLRRQGFDVHDFGDPAQALAHATTTTCHGAVLDWSMPGMDGGELCTRLRELPGLSEAPIVIVTAYADAATRERAAASGATEFVTKPFSLRQLAELMTTLLPADR